MTQPTPFAKLVAKEFGDFPEAERLRELFTAYATELFTDSVDNLTEREILAAHRAFTAYLVEETGSAQRRYVVPADWASAMVSDNPGFIADDEERGHYLSWIGYLIPQGGRNLLALDAQKVGPVFLSAVIDVHLAGVRGCLTPATCVPDNSGTLYWCQTIIVHFISNDC
jgi:hypothetical protein